MEPAEAVLAKRLRFQERSCARLGSPLYAALCGRAAADVEAHGPAWDVLRGHEGDPPGSALPLRLLGSVNRLVLEGREPQLAAFFEEDGDPADAWEPFRDVLARNVATLRELVELPVQTNEVGRCAALLPGFLAVADAFGRPLRLLEIGASAGLNLRWDRYRYRAEGFAWGPADSHVQIEFALADFGVYPAIGGATMQSASRGAWPRELPQRVEIASRQGCDEAPVDPTAPEGALTLLAYVWPDQRSRVERLRAALELAASVPVAVEREKAAAWISRQLAEPVAGQATVVFHSLVAQYLGDEEKAAFQRHLRDAAARATDDAPLAWLRMEPAGDWTEVRISTWPDGESRLVARAGYHGSPVEPIPHSF
ncbi:MAG TPA: DUF2332 domain-containing protein [Solirubrobacterales bacterium]|nr:DUF2332 domain-containing protein [Solirubrobacterales bacterium]